LRDGARPAPDAFELLDGALPGHAAEPGGRRFGGQPGDLVGDDPLIASEDRAALRRREELEEGDAGESVVAGSGRRRGLHEPAAELSPAGGRDPVEVAVGSAAGPEHPEDDVALPAEPGELRVDLRDLRLPDRLDLVADRAREVVARTRLRRKKAEEDVRKRQRETISTLI
jgi:hypothetical protein